MHMGLFTTYKCPLRFGCTGIWANFLVKKLLNSHHFCAWQRLSAIKVELKVELDGGAMVVRHLHKFLVQQLSYDAMDL